MTQTPDGHVPPIKNRSSKQNILLTKCKPAIRSVSNAVLQAWAQANIPGVHKEMKRRAEKGRGKTK